MKNVAICLGLSLLMGGCAIFGQVESLVKTGELMTPHKAFLGLYGSFVGRDLFPGVAPLPIKSMEESFERDVYKETKNTFGFIGFKKITNGNWEFEGTVNRGSCKIFYEYDPVKRVTLRWWYIGSDAECISSLN